MITFDLATLVDRPLADVFAFLSNPLNLPKWQSMVASIEPVTSGAVGVGSKYKVAAEMLGRKIDGLMEITTFAPPEKFGFTNQAGPMQVTVTVTLKTVGTGAKIALHGEGNPGGVFKIAEGVLAGQVKSQMEANLAKLKAVLESGA
jgi:carbon monoxide dehydrogenase subunit G